MLGSITPLGERGRGQPYLSTITFFLLGSAAAGAGIGAALGGLGSLVGGRGTVALAVLAGLVVAGLVFDLRLLGGSVPSVHRQVDETWLTRFRGWVYGLGFGFQLGLGVVTIVTTSAVYVALAAALLSGSFAGGAVIGLAFGVVRWVCAAAGVVVRTPADLPKVASLTAQFDEPARRATLAAQFVALLTLIALLAL